MSLKSLAAISIFVLTLSFSAPRTASAQTVSTLGLDSSTSTTYECVRYPDSKLNSVRMTKSGKSKTVKISAAKIKLNDRQAQLKTRKTSLKDLLKQAKKDKKAGLLHPKEAEKAQAKIDKLNLRITEVNGQIAILKAIVKSLPACSKPADPHINGTVQILSGLYNGGSEFYVTVVYLFDVKLATTNLFCAYVSGNSQIHPGWSQVTSQEAPLLSELLPTSGVCFRLGFECIDPKTEVAVVFASRTGYQNPGHCIKPADCSLDAALSEAHAYWGGMIVHDMMPKVGSICPQNL